MCLSLQSIWFLHSFGHKDIDVSVNKFVLYCEIPYILDSMPIINITIPVPPPFFFSHFIHLLCNPVFILIERDILFFQFKIICYHWCFPYPFYFIDNRSSTFKKYLRFHTYSIRTYSFFSVYTIGDGPVSIPFRLLTWAFNINYVQPWQWQ